MHCTLEYNNEISRLIWEYSKERTTYMNKTKTESMFIALPYKVSINSDAQQEPGLLRVLLIFSVNFTCKFKSGLIPKS